MRIKEAAELTDTTVRTIRWYHQEDLVPVPPVRGGRRDYQLSHVARVLRVRWLAQAGLPLSAVRDLLDSERATEGGDLPQTETDDDDRAPSPTGVAGSAEPSKTVSDLYATLHHIDATIEDLHAQRARVLHLIDATEEGRGLSSIPPQIHAIYSKLETAAPQDPQIQRVLRRERRMAEMLCQRGLIRSDVVDALAMDDCAIEACVEFVKRFAGIKQLPAEHVEAEAESLSADMLTWCLQHPELMQLYLALLPGWNTPAVRSVVLRLLMLEYRDPRQRAVINRTLTGLNTLIDQGAFAPEAPAQVQAQVGIRAQARRQTLAQAHTRPADRNPDMTTSQSLGA